MSISNFIESYLPKQIFGKIDSFKENIYDEEMINKMLIDIWNTQNDETDLENFSFIHSVRLTRTKSNTLIKLFLLTFPHDNKEEQGVSAVLLFTNKKEFKFFGFKELDDKIVPLTYLNKNQKYLLFEIEKELNFRNWGSLINTRNLSEVTQGVLSISGM